MTSVSEAQWKKMLRLRIGGCAGCFPELAAAFTGNAPELEMMLERVRECAALRSQPTANGEHCVAAYF